MNFKRIITGLMAVCVIGAALPSAYGKTADNAVITANAYTEGKEGVLSYENYGDHIVISGCDESATSIVIPAKIKGVPVTGIGESAFELSESLTQITIPNSVTSIGNGAFGYCENLTEINLSNSVTSIGEAAFSYCYSLTEITIPKSVKSIDLWAFLSCTGLTKITINNPNCEIHNSKSTINDTATIYGYDNSTAQAYAEKNERKFVSLGEAPKKEMGDIDGDGKVDSSDASLVLSEYSLLSTGKNGNFSESQKKRADLNKDGKIDSSDASLILAYYSYVSTDGTDSIEDFLAKQGY